MSPTPSPPPLPFPIDREYLRETLFKLLQIHSPTGYTDPIVREVCGQLERLGVPFELTRRGAIRARLGGAEDAPHRALVAHVDTLGAMVRELKLNGRLGLVPLGTWSARFAEGARVSVFTDTGVYRGTILPLKASGHTYHEQVDLQPISWSNLELRVDEAVADASELRERGFRIGDFVGVDSAPEFLPNGFINARHLDDKAGVATLLAAAKYLREHQIELPALTYLLFTISEEVGSGASAVLTGDIAEMITIDNGTVADGQASREFGVTVAMADSTGPFDYHLTHQVMNLCEVYGLPYERDIFRYYRCDSASALQAGNDTRTALVTFGVDASHGYERTNFDSLVCIAQLVLAYVQSEVMYRQQKSLTQLADFPQTRMVDVQMETHEQHGAVAQVPPEKHEPKPTADS